MKSFVLALALTFFVGAVTNVPAATVVSVAKEQAKAAPASTGNPIVFVTQFPCPNCFAGINSPFANHLADMKSAPPGGDLWIHYADGTERNLTLAAGLGMTGLQGANAIAVRDPAVSWDGSTIVFAIRIGAPTQYHYNDYYWQLYEIKNFGQGQTPVVTKVPNQPANYNNTQPSYASDGGILFSSDQPRNMQRYLYPQLDEYETTATTTGIWKLKGAQLAQLTNDPSGSFNPLVDTYGRIVFSRWDHLQQDQQCDSGQAGCIDWASEAQDAVTTTAVKNVFPEKRVGMPAPYTNMRMNEFLPWSVNQDGTTEETLNHIGRHELNSYFDRNRTDDPKIIEFSPATTVRKNTNSIANMHYVTPDFTTPGRYLGVDADEFFTDTAGQIVSINLPIGTPADLAQVSYLTPRSTAGFTQGEPPAADFNGRYRNPQTLMDGTLIAASADATSAPVDKNLGTVASPDPRYKFRIIRLSAPPRNSAGDATGYAQRGAFLTPGISKNISYYDPDTLVTYAGPLWELNPVEVVARPIPPTRTTALETPELSAYAEAGVDPAVYKAFLIENNLTLFSARNVTSADKLDKQQPYNLSVPGGVTTVAPGGGHVYNISKAQIYEAKAVRGNTNKQGRRLLDVPLDDPLSLAQLPGGQVTIASDGSIAFVVEALRPISWELLAPDGTVVKRERYHISGSKGEHRACDSCHGVNTTNQAGAGVPQNENKALVALLQKWAVDHGTPPPTCTNAQPTDSPMCADGTHQIGGIWVHDPFPGCAWHYDGGHCVVTPPPPTVKIDLLITQTTKGVVTTCKLDGLLPYAYVPPVIPVGAQPKVYPFKITQDTTTCNFPSTNNIKGTFTVH